MKEFTYVIQDAEGLHARPAGLIVKLAQTMDSRVTLTANEKTADCTVEGGDEDAACRALQDFCQAEL